MEVHVAGPHRDLHETAMLECGEAAITIDIAGGGTVKERHSLTDTLNSGNYVALARLHDPYTSTIKSSLAFE